MYPQQHPPESTILHQFAAKKIIIPGDPPFKHSWKRAWLWHLREVNYPLLKCGVAINILKEYNPVMTMIPSIKPKFEVDPARWINKTYP